MSKRKRQLSRAALLTMAALTLSSAPVSALQGLTLLTAYAEEPQGSLVIPSAEAAIEAGFNTRGDSAHLKYHLKFTIPDNVRDGDTVLIQTRNLSDFIPAGVDFLMIRVDGKIVGRLDRRNTVSKAALADSADTTIAEKRDANLAAGLRDTDYRLTFNVNAHDARGKDIVLTADTDEAATKVSENTQVTADIRVNRQSILQTQLTIPKYRVDQRLDVGKMTFTMEDGTSVTLKDGHLTDSNLAIRMVPYGRVLKPGSRFNVKLGNAGDILKFVKNTSITNPGFAVHTADVTATSEHNANNVYLMRSDIVRFKIDSVMDDEIVLELLDGELKDNNVYVLNTKDSGIGIELKSGALDALNTDGTAIGPVGIDVMIADQKGAPVTALNNRIKVAVYGDTLDRDKLSNVLAEKMSTRFVDDATGEDIADRVSNEDEPSSPIEISGYYFVKTVTMGSETIHYYHKVADLPAGIRLTEYTDSFGKQIAAPVMAMTTMPSKLIPGYTFVRTDNTETGARHVYTEAAKTEVITRYLAYGTNEKLADDKEGLDAARQLDINGYVFRNKETDRNGNVTYWYVRQEHAHVREVVTNWVDLENKALKTPVTDTAMRPADTIGGYEYVRTDTADDGATVTHVFKKLDNAETPVGDVYTKYIDEKGLDLREMTHGAEAGKPIDIDGYKFLKTVVVDKTHVEHVYAKTVSVDTSKASSESTTSNRGLNEVHTNAKEIVTRFVDDKGTSLRDSITDTKERNYVQLDGYVFDHTEVNGNEVKHVYRVYAGSPFTTYFKDADNGEELHDSVTAKGSVPPYQFEGYVYKRTDGNSSTGFTHYYVKGNDRTTLTNVTKNSSSTSDSNRRTDESILTRYQDKSGNQISASVTDKKRGEKKSIEGYRYLNTDESSDGKTVTYVYEKVTDYTVRFVDKNGDRIKDSVKSKTVPRYEEIEGYKFVETKVDGDTVTHTYRKLTDSEYKEKYGKDRDSSKSETKSPTITPNNSNSNVKADVKAYVKPDVKPDTKPYIKTGVDVKHAVPFVLGGLMALTAGAVIFFTHYRKKLFESEEI